MTASSGDRTKGKLMADLAFLGSVLQQRQEQITLAVKSPEAMSHYAALAEGTADELIRVAAKLRNMKPGIEGTFGRP